MSREDVLTMTTPEPEFDDDFDDDPDCTWCGGDGWEECGIPLECTARHIFDEHPCGACAGTGLRSKQTVF